MKFFRNRPKLGIFINVAMLSWFKKIGVLNTVSKKIRIMYEILSNLLKVIHPEKRVIAFLINIFHLRNSDSAIKRVRLSNSSCRFQVSGFRFQALGFTDT